MRSSALVVATLVACGTANGRAPQATSDGGSAGSPLGGEAGAALPEAGGAGGDLAGQAGAGDASTEMAGGTQGLAGLGGCDPAAADAEPPPRARGLALAQIAVFQGVKVPIMELGQQLSSRKANLVSGRPALLRAYVEPADGWRPRLVTARLSVSVSGQRQEYEQSRLVLQASNDAQLTSTFNFELPSEVMTEAATYSIELLEGEPCVSSSGDDGAARFPRDDEVALGVLPGATLQVQIVPIAYQAGNVELVPDSSPEQLERLRRQVQRLFPIAGVELTLRAQSLTATGATMLEVLDQVAALREQESPAPNVVYYGLVRLTETHAEYCAPSCVLGASFNGELPSVGVGVGIGYSGDESVRTFAHELGHVLGRPHTPCAVAGDVNYPYSGGRIGSWGYDVDEKTLFEPNTYTDFMGYCQPAWVSDHTYEHLREFIAGIEPAPAATRVLSDVAVAVAEQRYRTLLIEPGKPPVWGALRTLRGAPGGRPELAQAFDTNGRAAGRPATVFRRSVSDTAAEIVYVPQWVDRGWASLKLSHERVPLPAERAP